MQLLNTNQLQEINGGVKYGQLFCGVLELGGGVCGIFSGNAPLAITGLYCGACEVCGAFE